MVPSSTRRPIARLLVDALARDPDRAALVTPDRAGGADRVVTAAGVLAEAARVADALDVLGVGNGESVLLLSENRERWFLCDLALLALGCPDVPRGADSPAEEIGYIVEKVRARVAFVEKPDLLARFAGHPALEIVVLLSGDAKEAAEWFSAQEGPRIFTWEELLQRARPDAAARFAAKVAERRADEVATIVFTSGTTGRPKGVVLTQANLASNLEQVLTIIEYMRGHGTVLSILPPWHMFERMVEYALLALGLRLVYSSRRHFAKDLVERSPAAVAAVPRIWMMLMEGVRAKVESAPPRKRRLVEFALALAADREKRRRFPETPTSLKKTLLAPLDLLLRRLVLSKIVAALGAPNLRGGFAVSGGGTLPDHVDLFFASLGIDLMNGWGLTETSPVLTLRVNGHNAGGTIGRPLAETEVEARDPESGVPLPEVSHGVLHARGPQVMRGYLDEPDATAAVLAPDGWFNTGDLGAVRRDGNVVITGRAKDTIVLLSGENVEPEPIENALASSPLIEQVVVVGQDQKHLAALVVARANADGTRGDPANGALLSRIRREIDTLVNADRGFRGHERIVRFKLLERPFSVEEGLLSQTLKVKRAAVVERYALEIAELFEEARGG
jgi:long-chain acyl-CoA synthetase